jgi:hypothetical protein
LVADKPDAGLHKQKMSDPFSKLFDDYPLMQGAVPRPPSSSSTSTSFAPSTNSLASAASLFALPSSTPVKATENKKIRRLPRDIIKKGTYGPEYEKWREEQDRIEEEERLRALNPPASPSSAVPVAGATSVTAVAPVAVQVS